MPTQTLSTDYLVIGAGAAGMAFTDSLIANTDAQVVIVDRRHRPGGHWNDAYPFIRLHQPSAFYGVSSLTLGTDSIDRVGPNAGCYETATSAQICGYYDQVMQQHLLPSGKVQFFPMCDYVGNHSGQHRFVSRLTGESFNVVVRRKLVDATYLETAVPATHTPRYEIVPGATLVPVNELVRAGKPPTGYVIFGAGKTAMDACLWLLGNGVAPEEIRWIKPRDSWLLDRAYSQPLELVSSIIDGISLQLEAVAQAESADDVLLQLEKRGQLLRIDPKETPTMYRCATVNAVELEQLRRIRNVVRMGRVQRLQLERIVLDHGTISTSPSNLHVDCTARGIVAKPALPIFAADRITLQQVRVCQPSFNSALIGYVEATRSDLAEQNRLCPPTPYPERPSDWVRILYNTLLAAQQWAATPDVQAWVESTRLNGARGMAQHGAEPRMQAAFQRYGENVAPALEKLARFSAAQA